MSVLTTKYPSSATEEQYKRIMTNWKDLNQYGQSRVTESVLRKIEEEGESFFQPIEEAEESVIDGAIGFIHSTSGIVAMLILLISLFLCCGFLYLCKGCIHDRGVRRTLNNISSINNSGQKPQPNSNGAIPVV